LLSLFFFCVNCFTLRGADCNLWPFLTIPGCQLCVSFLYSFAGQLNWVASVSFIFIYRFLYSSSSSTKNFLFLFIEFLFLNHLEGQERNANHFWNWRHSRVWASVTRFESIIV
jgi:hypothetical protein